MNNTAAIQFYAIIAAVCCLLFFVMLALWFTLRKKHQMLKEESRYDPVSGALTETGFSEQWVLNYRPHAETISIVSMQICGLAEIRSVYGAQAYQRLLEHLTGMLTEQLGRKDSAARCGEDSFCFVIHSRKQAEISQKLESIRRALKQITEDRLGVPALVPVCGVYFPGKEESAAQLMEKAAAVRPFSPQECTIVYDDPARISQTEREQELVSSLESAIQNRELVVYYQPKIRLSDYQIIGMEALVRWRHPQKGILTPDMFLPALERCHADARMDRFVWGEVCRLLARLKSEEREICPVSINLSATDLANPDIFEHLYELCCQYEVDPAQIEVECKEHILTKNLAWTKEQVRHLRDYHFRFSIDNFGAGYVALSLLRELEPDVIKLDRSFFSGRNNNRQGRILLDTLLKHCAQLHIFTVAEGVDNRAQVQYLQQAACDSAQGFYFLKPIPQERLLQLIYDNKALRHVQAENAAETAASQQKDQSFEQSQNTAQNIIQFAYWPKKDLAEFSDRFSPLLEAGGLIAHASSFLRSSALIYENDKEDFFALLDRSRKNDGWVENTLRFYGPAKRYEWMELRLKRELHSGEERINGMLVNMAGWRNEINRWKEKATRDAMTGVYNKDYFEQNVRKSLDNPGYQNASMIFIDMDYMKKMNDTYGHMFTDDVIRYLAKQLTSIFRHTDIIARYGGDEFMVFAPSMDREVLKNRLDRLYQVFTYPYRSDTKEFYVSVSIGAAFFGKDGHDYDTLLDHADCALYEAKERGRNQYAFYEPYMMGDPAEAATAVPANTDTEW